MAERNAFENIFNPDSGGFQGQIGRAFGVQTGEERAGSARAEAMRNLAELQASGKTGQQALVEYMKTSKGIDLFINDPDAMKMLSEFGKATSPRDPMFANTAPGHRTTIYDPNTGKMSEVAQPTAAMQDFAGYTAVARLPEARLREIAEMQLLPADQRTTAVERAMRDLVQTGDVDRGTALKIVGGAIEIKELKNSFGENTGELALVDKANGSVRHLRPTASAPGGVGAAQPIPPHAVNTDGTVDPRKAFPDDKRTMFLGSGLYPNVTAAISHVMSATIDPSLGNQAGRTSTARQDYLQQLQVAITSFPEVVGRSAQVIKQMQALVPSGGLLEDPYTAIGKGIKIHDLASSEIAAEEATIADRNQPKSSKVKANERRIGWHNVLRALPERAAMTELQNAVNEGTSGAMGAREGLSAVGEIYNTAKEGIRGQVSKKPGEPNNINTTLDFTKMTEAQIRRLNIKSLSNAQLNALRQRIQILKSQR